MSPNVIDPSIYPPSNALLSRPNNPPLGPLSDLPPNAQGLKEWKILLLVTAINSFSQRVITYLNFLGFKNVSVVIATGREVMVDSAERFQPDLVVCPFLTAIIPDSIFSKYITLVVHPGPPGDAGPSSLDWVLLGDTGDIPDSTLALQHVMSSHDDLPLERKQRSHWGTIVFQANEELDGGSVWAWEQYPLPLIGTTTKASLYQNQHSSAAITALTEAMIRVYTTTANLPPSERVKAKPQSQWQELSVKDKKPFMGGKTCERPILPPKLRKPEWNLHSAEDILRIIHASDSQPGAQLDPLSNKSKTSLFIYGGHLHMEVKTVPPTLYHSLGYESFEDVPAGTPIATRSGAVFFKTRKKGDSKGAVGIWITHGRVPKKLGQALEPKIPLVEAIKAAGHAEVLKGVQEWDQGGFEEVEGTWQEVYVKTIVQDGRLAQLVYWDFYNGAFSTQQCRLLLQALQWAAAPERGNVKILALMGGAYFSNGIALNTIEHASDPGMETWHNINAIDDIVEFLVSDTHAERSPFMRDSKALCRRGIVTVACLRGNAAAGGVALAAGCDVVMASRGVVLNPAYRGMGLHGSEFHSFSYLERCGQKVAASMLRDMLPQSSYQSSRTGLVDIEIGTYSQTQSDTHPLYINELRTLLSAPSSAQAHCAPWCNPSSSPTPPSTERRLIESMSETKQAFYKTRKTPLLHCRTEELSQMLLDCKHPIRSGRYHARRYVFIRKVKNGNTKTPSRYLGALAPKLESGRERDEEELEGFDDAPGWKRGEEWGWVGLDVPDCLKTSEGTRIALYPNSRRDTINTEQAVQDEHTDEPRPIVEEVEGGNHDLSAISVEDNNKLSSSTSSSRSSSRGKHSSESTESVPYPLTPPLNKQSKPFFRRKESTQSAKSDKSDKAASGQAVPKMQPPSAQVRDESVRFETGSKMGVFRSFKKRFSLSLRPSPSPAIGVEGDDAQGKKANRMSTPNESILRATTHKTDSVDNTDNIDNIERNINRGTGNAILEGIVGDGQKANGNIMVPSASGPEIRPNGAVLKGYTKPKIEGDDQVDFPCLYEPDKLEEEKTNKFDASAGAVKA